MIVSAGLDLMVCLGIYRVQFSCLSFFPPSSVHNIYDLYIRAYTFTKNIQYIQYGVKPRFLWTGGSTVACIRCSPWQKYVLLSAVVTTQLVQELY